MSTSDPEVHTASHAVAQPRQDAGESTQARLYPYTYEEAEEDEVEAPGTERAQSATSQQEQVSIEGLVRACTTSACENRMCRLLCRDMAMLKLSLLRN